MTGSCFLRKDNSLLTCEDLSDFKHYEDYLFEIFMNIYEEGRLSYKGITVQMKHYPPDYGERSGFYHLTCENFNHTGNEEDRVPNLRRCERITWPQTVLEKCSTTCPDLLIWENNRGGKQNILLFCPTLDYLVVLGKRTGYLLLITAYPVEYPNKRNDLMREYARYKQTTHSV